MRKIFGLSILSFLLTAPFLGAEIISINGTPARVGDVIQVTLQELYPTQPSVGFDKVYYKLGRYEKDRRKQFDDYCRKNGQEGILNLANQSNLHDLNSFACQQLPGWDRKEMKTVVIAPNDEIYLTDGHHTFNQFWHMQGGGPELKVYVVVDRDYRELSMESFWDQMKVEENVWLYDVYGHEIKIKDLPLSLGLENFTNDPYRSLMYFTRAIAWNTPGEITVPDPDTYDDRFPDIPFTEFYWARKVRKAVNLANYDLTTRVGYLSAIRAVGQAIMNVQDVEIGEKKMPAKEMGQFAFFNERELTRIDRPGTGKLAYMLGFKSRPAEKKIAGKRLEVGPLTYFQK